MARFNYIQNSFIRGELSPKLKGRTDLEEYFGGVAELRNFLVARQGGAVRRPGFRYDRTVTNSSPRLIPFIFSKTEAYVVAISNAGIEIYKNDGTQATVTNLLGSRSFFGNGSYDPFDHHYAQSGDVLVLSYNGSLTIPPLILARVSEDNFLLVSYLDSDQDLSFDFVDGDVTTGTDNIAETGHGLQTGTIVTVSNSGGALPTGLTALTDYYVIRVDDDNFKLASSRANALAGTAVDITAAAGGGTHTLAVTNDVAFLDQILRRPYIEPNVDPDKKLNPAAVSGSGVNVTAEDSSANAIAFFEPTHVGSYIKITHGSTTGVARITAFNSATTVQVEVLVNFGAATASDNWQESAWSDYQGWPNTVTIFEQRLIYGGTPLQTDTLWGSLVGNFYHFMERKLVQDSSSDTSGLNYFGSATDDDPFSFTIASQEVNAIQWLASSRTLQVGTLGAEYVATGGQNRILSSSSVSFTAQTRSGSTDVLPAGIDQTVLFVSRDGKRVREFLFSEENGSYVTRNLSLLSDDIINHQFTGSGNFAGIQIKEMIYQASRGILWCLTTRDALIALTIDKNADIVSWHRHTIGGTDVAIKGIASIPNSNGSFDDLYIAVDRTIDSSTVSYLEKMGDNFEHPALMNSSTDDDDIPWFSDSAKQAKLNTLGEDFVDGDVTVGTDNINISAHGYFDGTKVQLTTTGTLPTGLSTSTNYFVIKVDADNFKLATSRFNALAGTAIDITAASGGGTHTSTAIASTKFEGFDHLEGESVTVLSNGFVHPNVTVSSGTITVNTEVTEIIAGLPYTSLIQTLPVEAGATFGTAQGQLKRIDQVIVRVFKSYGTKIGPSETETDEIVYRPALLPMGDPLPLFTGDKTHKIDNPIDRNGQFVVMQDLPLPLTVAALILRGLTNDN